MSYRIEKQTNELVIDGWEKGISASPFTGIANISGLNTSYYPGVAYVNYRRQLCPMSGGTMTNPVSKTVSPAGLIYIQDDTGQIWKQDAVNAFSFSLLSGETGRLGAGNAGIAYWNNYLVVFGAGLIEFCGDGTGDTGIISTNWNTVNNSSGRAQNSAPFTTNFGVSPDRIATNPVAYALPKFQVNDPVKFTTTGTLPAPLVVGTTYYILDIVNVGINLRVSSTVGGSAISFSDNGTGTHTITDIDNPLPLGNSTSLIFTTNPSSVVDTISGTILSYKNPRGISIASGTWQEATGIYNIVYTDGTKVATLFTNGSKTINFLSPLAYLGLDGSGQYTFSVQLLDPTVTNYRPYVSKVDGNLYFANGSGVGSLIATNPNLQFNPSLNTSYSANNATFLLSTAGNQGYETVVDMVDLKSSLVIATQKNITTWDYTSSFSSSPVPIGEPIKKIDNILNIIYVLAGNKGNIYTSNGYSAQILAKLPDSITGVIDPVWSFGDLMFHRSRLFVQALAQDTTGNNLLAGIFSLIVSPSLLGEQSSGLVMENQNSYGLAPAPGALANGLLLDLDSASGNAQFDASTFDNSVFGPINGQDGYFSAWSNGATVGGIDYNDATPWQNYEPVIETDIIPTGSILDKKTFGAIHFKLDRPMVTGDSIKLYWRKSLSDTYTLIGTTSMNQLSEYFPSNVTESQWMQFKVAFACALGGSSRIPLREIRIQLT